MRVAIFTALALAAARADDAEPFPIPLSRETFPLYVHDDGLALVEFRRGGAPDAGFADAARLLRDVVPLGSVDALREPQLAAAHGVADAPALLLFDRGVGRPYEGGRAVKDIVHFALEALDRFAAGAAAAPAQVVRAAHEQVRLHEHDDDGAAAAPRALGDAPQPLHSATELRQLAQIEDVLLVGCVGPNASEARDAYREAAVALSGEYLALEAADEWLAPRVGCADPPSVVLLRAGAVGGGHDEVLEYEGPWEAEALAAWVREHGFVPLMPLTAHSARRRLLEEAVPSLVLLMPASHHADAASDASDAPPPSHARLLTALRELAREYKDDLAFCVANATAAMAPLASALALPARPAAPALALYDPMLQQRYVYPRALVDDDATAAGAAALRAQLRAFIDAFLDGELEATARSEPEPEEAGIVHHSTRPHKLVATSFERHVRDAGRDVLVMYHAPWCDHCAAAHELMREVGAALAKSEPPADGAPPLQLAELDVHANDMPAAHQVHSVPALLLFPAHQPHRRVLYDGALTADAVLRWLSRYSVAVPTPPETAAHTGGGGVGALTAALKAMQTTAAAQLRTEL